MADTPKAPAREGSLDAPFRHPIAWQDDAYYDLAAVEKEMERQFGRRVHLFLFVKVRENWPEDKERLRNMGLDV